MPLIINADDFGLTQGVNDAVFELASLGSLSSTTVMVNMPFADQAAKLAGLEHFSAGLHFNLTEGRPIAPADRVSSLLDETGCFYPQADFRQRLSAGLIRDADMAVELQAQFECLVQLLGATPSHIDSHQNIHKAPAVARMLMVFGANNPGLGVRAPARYLWIADKQRIRPSILQSLRKAHVTRAVKELYLYRLSSQLRRSFRSPKGEVHAENFKKLALLKIFAEQTFTGHPVDEIYEIACHPSKSIEGLDNSKLKEQRLEEFEALSSKNACEFLQAVGLCTFDDLK